MKTLTVNAKALKTAGRWDIDFHLPPTGITAFPKEVLAPVMKAADIVKTKRDPTKRPETSFLYVDIASIDVETGIVQIPQELTGEEAPSRARKVVHAYDVIISTCRPTRGAIAVIPENLHGQICSTGFSVVRAKAGVNPFYLHYALRLASTLEQFRKWATGSSYPAILDEDVAKTLIPLPEARIQDQIAKTIRSAVAEREKAIKDANMRWQQAVEGVIKGLTNGGAIPACAAENGIIYSIEQVQARLGQLPSVEEEAVSSDDEIMEESLFESEVEAE